MVVDESGRRVPLDAAQPDAIRGEGVRQCASDGLVRSLEIAAELSLVEFGGGLEHAVAGPGALVEVQAKSVGGGRHILNYARSFSQGPSKCLKYLSNARQWLFANPWIISRIGDNRCALPGRPGGSHAVTGPQSAAQRRRIHGVETVSTSAGRSAGLSGCARVSSRGSVPARRFRAIGKRVQSGVEAGCKPGAGMVGPGTHRRMLVSPQDSGSIFRAGIRAESERSENFSRLGLAAAWPPAHRSARKVRDHGGPETECRRSRSSAPAYSTR